MRAHVGLSAKEKSNMLISKETLTGLRITGNNNILCTSVNFNTYFSVNSFIELVRYLFSLQGVKSFLSEKISQDPLEKFFGCQRQRGGVNENPNVSQFLKGNQALRVINAINLDLTQGNTRGSNHSTLPGDKENAMPLSKRKRNSKTGNKCLSIKHIAVISLIVNASILHHYTYPSPMEPHIMDT